MWWPVGELYHEGASIHSSHGTSRYDGSSERESLKGIWMVHMLHSALHFILYSCLGSTLHSYLVSLWFHFARLTTRDNIMVTSWNLNCLHAPPHSPFHHWLLLLFDLTFIPFVSLVLLCLAHYWWWYLSSS